ncbi:Ppx/GppA phosphatase family protein [Nocardia transvalensis]|uniref:Ppx/GppA phosphatase family protein n=1 Tax=Nocardia transvalensis TaxID=37333 RepID=UPI001E502846|nr:Ppx/GppA phosphatase family protein [Nocardia transvalensis]
MSDRVAAVDCGTNSIRLLIAEVGPDARLSDVHREMRIVRLGKGVDATGELNPEAIERTRAALHDYVDLMLDKGVKRVRMVATSATRDARNRDDFFSMAAAELARVVPGARAEVITGDEEARLSFAGAVGELSSAEGPFVVVDLGGGSTEVVLGDSTGVQAAYSADIGCVRITERCLHGNPPTPEEVASARFFASQRLAQAFGVVPVERARTWVGVAGTMTTIAAVALDLPEYDSEKVHLTRMRLNQVRAVCHRLIGMNHDERAALGPMHPGRVDVIGGGAVITEVLADELARRAGISELIVSEHDILDGIALSIA